MRSQIDVSRETSDKLADYIEQVQKWNKKINLVAKSTLADAWTRHVVDSLQITKLFSAKTERFLDLGSGAGFPAVVYSIYLDELLDDHFTTMVESDARKSVFLREMVRRYDLNAAVINGRIENTKAQSADVVTARALADLSKLLEFTSIHLKPTGKAIFLKGRLAEAEIEHARGFWAFDLAQYPSMTDGDASILEISKLSHV